MKLAQALTLALFLCASLAAQASVSIEALSPCGVALNDGSQLLSQGFAVNQPFSQNTVAHVQTHGTGSPYFIDWIETKVKPPILPGTFYQSLVAIESKAFAKKGTVVPTLFTTGATPGQPGTQTFRVTLTSAQSQNVDLEVWASGQNYGNAAIATAMTLGTTTHNWSWQFGQGYVSNHITIPHTVNGTSTIDVTITGQVTPGTGGGAWTDGYDVRWSMTVVPINPGTISYYGQGCGQATLGHIGTPMTGSHFTLAVNNAPPGAPVYFMIGTQNLIVPFLGLTLPYDLSAVGAPGCWLLVGSPALFWIVGGDPAAPNTLSLYLSPWRSGTYYVQALVFDPAANPAGQTFTQAAQITF